MTRKATDQVTTIGVDIGKTASTPSAFMAAWGHERKSIGDMGMSAFGGKAVVPATWSVLPLLAKSGRCARSP